MQVADILSKILGKIGAIAINETPPAADMNACLMTVNLMLDQWSAQNLMLRAAIKEHFTLVANQASYTIGTGGNFNTSKPIAVQSAFVRDSSNTDYPLDIVNRDIFDSYSDKVAAIGRPMALYYDPGATQQSSQLGTVNLYYKPDTAYTIYIDNQKYLSEFSGLSDVITLEKAYLNAIVWNSAKEIWPEFHRSKQLPAIVANMAAQTKRVIETMNAKPLIAATDIPGTKTRPFNIYSGE